jgi:hypothetical protein
MAADRPGDVVARLQCLPDEAGAERSWQSDTEYYGQAAIRWAASFFGAMISDRTRVLAGTSHEPVEEAGAGEMR